MTLEIVGAVFAILMGVCNFSYLILKDKGKDVWNLADRMNKLDQSRLEFRETIVQQVEAKYDEAINRFGESMHSHAEHVRLLEVELYKNFVRNELFRDSIAMLSAGMNERLNRIEHRFDIIEKLLRERS